MTLHRPLSQHRPHSQHRPLTALALAAALAAALTACSVNVVEGPRPAPSAVDDSGSDTTADDSVDAAPSPESGTDANANIDRDSLIAAATIVRRCDGELIILHESEILRIEGACDHLILNGSGSQIVTDDVTFIEMIGDGNVVLSGAVDELLVNGTGNLVHWQGATPTITETGSVNVLKAG